MTALASNRTTFQFPRWLFARLLGAILLCAFVSLAVQVRGLCGARGIVPAADFLNAVHEQLGSAGWWKVPTIFWLGAGDGALTDACWAGAAVAILMMAGVSPGACSLVCWALYLSLCSVCSPFLNFQWDILLLEAALLAAFALPWHWRPAWRIHTPAARLAWWLLWWLNFRLLFESGVVKLTSGDPTWRDLTALSFHFETQCIPLPSAWLAHQMPLWILQAATIVMFALELVAPWLILLPGRWRRGAAFAMILLQVGILTTGNYAFFNWLSIALCVPLLDDSFWPARWRERLLPERPRNARGREWTLWLFAPVAFVIVLVTTAELERSFHQRGDWRPQWKPAVFTTMENLAPLRSLNGYGLFRVMTTERPEIIVEGSNDGVRWEAYDFRFKPGPVRRAPPIVAPHQPRLDWQMWFAALGSVQQNPWFVNLMVRLLEGSPEVLDLLARNPFPGHPPRYVRAVLYDYHFTRWSDDTAAWWTRERKGLYCPPISLK